MFTLSAWPIKYVFRLLAAVTVVVCAATAVVVTGSYLTQEHQRIQFRTALTAETDIRRIGTLSAGSATETLLIAYVPGAGAVAGPAQTQDLAEIQTLVSQAAALDIPSADKQLVRTVGTRYSALATWLHSLSAPVTPAAAVAAEREDLTLSGAADVAVAAALKALEDRSDHLDNETGATGRNANLITLALCLFTAGLVGGLILAYGRRITRGVGELHSAIEKVSAGDLTVPIVVHGRDELAQMTTALVGLRDRLITVFGHLVESSARLGGATSNLTGIVADVGHASELTSTEMGTVSATADEVSTNIQAVAAGGEEMGASIGEIARSANDAAREATMAVAAVESTTGTMEKLSDSSRQIGDVVRLITSIAEQTNLLALNATIEAARAGDAGKGFAVVADEVKQLAQETARATEDISRRVETIQADAVQAGAAIESVSGVISRINEFQSTIASAVEEQTATTQAINAGVNLAALGSAEIARTIGGVARAAATTADSMARGNASARELTQMRTELDALIATFRLPG